MQDFTESLRQLVVAEKIERATAFEVAPNVEQLENGAQGDYGRPTWYPLSPRHRSSNVTQRRSPLDGTPIATPTVLAATLGAERSVGPSDWSIGSSEPIGACIRRKASDDPSAPRPRDVRPVDPRRRRRGRRRRVRRRLASPRRRTIAARARALPQPLQVRPRPAHLPDLGLDHRLGRRRRQGAEQPQVRALELASSSSPACSAWPWSGRSRSTRSA